MPVPHVPPLVGKQPSPVAASTSGGVGTEMLKILAWTHWFVRSDKCGCRAEAARWDKMGISWCEENRDHLEGRLLAMASKYSIPTTQAVVSKLVTWAIRRAKKAMAAK